MICLGRRLIRQLTAVVCLGSRGVAGESGWVDSDVRRQGQVRDVRPDAAAQGRTQGQRRRSTQAAGDHQSLGGR